MRPDLSRVPSFYHNYINHVPEDDLVEAFNAETPAFIQFIENIPPDKYDYRYANGKWTIKEVLQHIIDAERIFAYRALRFARKDPTFLMKIHLLTMPRLIKETGTILLKNLKP
jgi:hypothetical protein